ncbi:MAG: hypothetical protein E4H11_05980 [Myxococcales bacterium]|nr:MAG: hypothetical protein E4H11_05980 [Myxococcales bacterium]
MALDEGGGVILVTDRGDATQVPSVVPSVLRLVRLAEPPGRIAFAVPLAAGAPLETPAGIAIDGDRSILVSDAGATASADDGKVIRIDALSGLQSLVATAGTLDEPTGIGVRAPAAGAFVDQDGDGITDVEDNCIAVANADQLDTDLDFIGNACDPDFNNNGIVDTADFLAIRAAFGTNDPNVDIDGDGVVTLAEFVVLRSCFGLSPGQSGLLLFNPDAGYCWPGAPSP